MATSRRSQEERVAESSERLLSAAIELIAEQGFDRTTAAEIGKRAGYSHGMVHVRFGSKDALLESIVRAYEDAMLPAVPPELTGLEQVLHQLDSAQAHSQQEPEFFRAFCVLCFETIGPNGTLREWVSDWFERYVDHTARRLTAGQADGSVRSDIDPREEARRLLHEGIGITFLWLVDGEPASTEQLFDTLRGRLLRNVATS